jgi:DNA-binding transcriptional ArsR family regulator
MKEIADQSELEERIATLFRALGNPARVHILAELAKSPRSAGELVARLPLAQSTVSEHLSVLKNAGIIRTLRGARWYCLEPKMLDTVIAFCDELRGPRAAAGATHSHGMPGRYREAVPPMRKDSAA